jgi:hypothetical protein
MKNIHVLPTDKPSRIYLIKSNNKLGITSNNPEFTENFGSGTQNQNIYITSDEEINEGDWFVHSSHGITNIYKAKSVVPESIITTCDNGCWVQYCKKIILTTDQDLIKDGVQAIDDEFLEWFVKNPSCEEVEIMFACRGFNGVIPNLIPIGEYKIIIPKEEPKCTCKEHDPYCCQVHGSCPTCVKQEEPKQETLEEVAENYKIKTIKSGRSHRVEYTKQIKLDFIAGAKWQQERSYSEEDLKEAFLGVFNSRTFEEWFEQFKKK